MRQTTHEISQLDAAVLTEVRPLVQEMNRLHRGLLGIGSAIIEPLRGGSRR
jgi:hypothetical protein